MSNRKLYRVSVILGMTTIDRAIWADEMRISDGCYFFHDHEEGGFKVLGATNLVAAYPTSHTFITNIETLEQYERRKTS